jgi:hypothetical protein
MTPRWKCRECGRVTIVSFTDKSHLKEGTPFTLAGLSDQANVCNGEFDEVKGNGESPE